MTFDTPLATLANVSKSILSGVSLFSRYAPSPQTIATPSSCTGIALIIGGVGLNYAGLHPWTVLSIPVKTAGGQYTTQADAFFEGDLPTQKALADRVIADLQAGIDTDAFGTGSDRYNAEWTVATYQMAALGLTQISLEHPEVREQYLPMIELCLEQLLKAETVKFGTQAWGDNGLSDFSSDNGHAYLGYTNLALSLYRKLKPDNRFAAINDQLTEALARRLEKAPHGIIETYPYEAYPPDLSAVIGSIALYDQATGADHQQMLQRTLKTFRDQFIDSKSKLVYQAVNAKSGEVRDRPRGSGTALSVYFLSFADPELAGELYQAIAAQQTRVGALAAFENIPTVLRARGMSILDRWCWVCRRLPAYLRSVGRGFMAIARSSDLSIAQWICLGASQTTKIALRTKWEGHWARLYCWQW